MRNRKEFRQVRWREKERRRGHISGCKGGREEVNSKVEKYFAPRQA